MTAPKHGVVVRADLCAESVTIVWMARIRGGDHRRCVRAAFSLRTFGIDSAIELISGAVLLWRIRHEGSGHAELVEKRAAKISRMPRQRGLKREAAAGGGIAIDLSEHQATGAKRGGFGIEWGKTSSDQISIDEKRTARLKGQKLPIGSRFHSRSFASHPPPEVRNGSKRTDSGQRISGENRGKDNLRARHSARR
jgi:hypothetical protein